MLKQSSTPSKRCTTRHLSALNSITKTSKPTSRASSTGWWTYSVCTCLQIIFRSSQSMRTGWIIVATRLIINHSGAHMLLSTKRTRKKRRLPLTTSCEAAVSRLVVSGWWRHPLTAHDKASNCIRPKSTSSRNVSNSSAIWSRSSISRGSLCSRRSRLSQSGGIKSSSFSGTKSPQLRAASGRHRTPRSNWSSR